MQSLSSQHGLWHRWIKQKCYLGSWETIFKDRFRNHKKSFNNAKHKNETELSKERWEIKKHSGTPKVTWKIIRICRSYNPNSKRCLLCLNEKYEIATYKGDNLLNKRTQMIKTFTLIYKFSVFKSLRQAYLKFKLSYSKFN